MVARSRMGLVRNYAVTQKFSCVGCENPLATGERARECEFCRQWPLCGDCFKRHELVNGFNRHPEPGELA